MDGCEHRAEVAQVEAAEADDSTPHPTLPHQGATEHAQNEQKEQELEKRLTKLNKYTE